MQELFQRMAEIEESSASVDSMKDQQERAIGDMQENMRKMRDFVMNMNETLNGIIYAPKAETENALRNIERKINNLFKMQMKNSFSTTEKLAAEEGVVDQDEH